MEKFEETVLHTFYFCHNLFSLKKIIQHLSLTHSPDISSLYCMGEHRFPTTVNNLEQSGLQYFKYNLNN